MAKEKVKAKKVPQPKPGTPAYSKYYINALKGDFTSIKPQESKPQCGYYRAKVDGIFIPVTFFCDDTDEEEVTCSVVRGGEARVVEGAARVAQYWTWAAKNPVFADDWWIAHDTGNWPDNPKDEKEDELRANLPDDPGEANRIESLAKVDFANEWLKKHPKITTQEDANAAVALENQLRELLKAADPLHKAEKQPWLDGGKAVDDKYRYRVTLDSTIDGIKELRTAFQRLLDKQKRAEAEAAAAAAAKAREEALAKARAEGGEPEIVAALPPVAPATFEKTVAKGGFGRGATVSRTYRGEIVNLTTALLHFQNNAKVREALEGAIKAELRANKEHSFIPGVRVWDDLDKLISDGTKGSATSEVAAVAV